MRFLCITYSDYKRVENINFGGYYAAVGVYGEQWHPLLPYELRGRNYCKWGTISIFLNIPSTINIFATTPINKHTPCPWSVLSVGELDPSASKDARISAEHQTLRQRAKGSAATDRNLTNLTSASAPLLRPIVHPPNSKLLDITKVPAKLQGIRATY
jgi:hypothetical protein